MEGRARMLRSAQDHQIRIGVIGPQPIVDRVLHMLATFPSFTPVAKVVECEEEVPELAADTAGEVEVLLLSDPVSQRRVKERLGPGGIPVVHTPVTDAGLYKALFRAHRAGYLRSAAGPGAKGSEVGGTVSGIANGERQGPGRKNGKQAKPAGEAEAHANLNLDVATGPGFGVTIDTLTQTMVSRALKDFDMARTAAIVYDGPAYASPDELVRFHREHHASGASAIAFTGMSSVARALTEQGIPCEWLLPSDQDIVGVLERALLSTETRRSNESQIVVGIVNIDDFGEVAARHNSEHEVQKLKLDVHRSILDYVESLEGYLSHLGGDEYLFFTTRGIFERETGGYKTIPLAKEVKKAYRISLSIGIGFGRSANEAGTNARVALRKTKEAGGNACFIVREDGTLIGPLEMAEPVEQVLSFTDAELIARAQQAGMTSAYLSKLLHHKARFGKSEYQVHELSALLGISIRSVHRLLLQWMDNGLVEIAAMEKVPRGRPRQIYRFVCLE